MRYIDRRRFTLKEAEDWCRAKVTKYLETDGQGLLDTLSDPGAVAKYDQRILVDPEYSNPENLTNRAKETVFTVLLSTPLDSDYPRFTIKARESKRWQRWLGLTPTDSVWYAMWKAFRTGWRGGEPVTEINAYLTARGIAREQGYNKGRIGNKAVSQLVDEGIVPKGITYTDDKGDTMTDIRDSKAETFVDDTERQMLLQRVNEIITDPRDKATLELYHAVFANGTTIENEHKRKLRKYQELGLRTTASVRQRMSRIPQKYPELRKLNPYR
ncbi:hypothetical protein ACFLYE_00225 [Chloroflexota bacterium]